MHSHHIYGIEIMLFEHPDEYGPAIDVSLIKFEKSFLWQYALVTVILLLRF